MENSRVAVIILNWNGWIDTIECLESLFQIDYQDYFVVLVDNNSTDESLNKIKDYSEGRVEVESRFLNFNPNNKPIETCWLSREESELKQGSNPEKLTVITSKVNQGFAEGNNIGIRYSLKFSPEYFLLLNNDTVVDENFLKEMVENGKNKDIGFLGPKMYYYDHPNKIWSVGGKIDWKFARGLHLGINEEDEGQYDQKMVIEYVNGAAILVKRDVISKVGLLDKKYFLYFEETDLSLRGLEIGYKSLYVPSAKIWHKVSISGGGIKKEIGLYYITRNRWLFTKKWASTGSYIFFIVYQAIAAVILPITLSIYFKNHRLFGAYLRGFWDGIFYK